MISEQLTKVQLLAKASREAFTVLDIPVQAAYLHGSWGTKYERSGSDIDLALLLPTALDPKKSLQLRLMLMHALDAGVDIDIAELRSVDTVFAAHVVSEARRFVVVDQQATEQFEALMLAKYARLNEERAGILADIRQRGTVYGTGTHA